MVVNREAKQPLRRAKLRREEARASPCKQMVQYARPAAGLLHVKLCLALLQLLMCAPADKAYPRYMPAEQSSTLRVPGYLTRQSVQSQQSTTHPGYLVVLQALAVVHQLASIQQRLQPLDHRLGTFSVPGCIMYLSSVWVGSRDSKGCREGAIQVCTHWGTTAAYQITPRLQTWGVTPALRLVRPCNASIPQRLFDLRSMAVPPPQADSTAAPGACTTDVGGSKM